MAGLLDFIKTPEGQGLLSAAFGGFAGARRGTPWNNVGRAGMAGLLGYGNAIDRQDKQAQLAKRNELFDIQLAQAKQEQEIAEGIRRAGAESMRTPAQMTMMNGQGPTVANAAAIENTQPGFDTQGFLSRVMAIDPLKGMSLQQGMAKDTPFGKVDPKDYTPESVAKFAQTRNFGDLQPVREMKIAPNGQVYNPFQLNPKQVFADPNKPFAVGPDGTLIPNLPYQQFAKSKARAGATNVSVNTEKSLLNNIAGDLGKSIVEARGQAQAAASTINTLSRLNEALNSGAVIAGPGANFKQYGLQLGEMLGINGKDANEKLLNTRQAIQSLAQLELDAAQQMKGQGQITENERAIIRRAAAGEIDQMTGSELRVLVGVLDRSARYKIETYQSQVQPLQANPDAAPLAPFLGIEMPSPLQSSSTNKVRRFNPATGRIE